MNEPEEPFDLKGLGLFEPELGPRRATHTSRRRRPTGLDNPATVR